MPALTIIHDETLVSDTATFDVASIPGGYAHLLIEVVGRITAAVQGDVVTLRLNNDSGANYAWSYHYQDTGTTSGGDGGASATSMRVGEMPGASATAGYVGAQEITIFDYAATTFHKAVRSRGVRVSNQRFVNDNGGIWQSTSAVTRITLTPGSGSFKAGSRITIYALPAAGIDLRISDLSAITSLVGSEEFVVNDSGASKKITADDISAAIGGETELDYVERTTNLTVTATTAATADTYITGSSVSYDGSTRVCIEAYCPNVEAVSTAGGAVTILLYEDSAQVGIIGFFGVGNGRTDDNQMLARRFLTPSAGSHTYSIRAYRTVGNGFLGSSTGGNDTLLPAYLRITRA